MSSQYIFDPTSTYIVSTSVMWSDYGGEPSCYIAGCTVVLPNWSTEHYKIYLKGDAIPIPNPIGDACYSQAIELPVKKLTPDEVFDRAKDKERERLQLNLKHAQAEYNRIVAAIAALD